LVDFYHYPIKLSGHAAERLGERFMLYDEDEIRHYIKKSEVVDPFGKEGSIGILQCQYGDRKIRFVCKISEKVLVVITVEEF
jgi:hypothetical protein